MIFREDDMRYLTMLDDTLADEGMEDAEDDEDDVMDDDSSDVDVDMAVCDRSELVVTRKCDGILDIVLVGEVRSFFSYPLSFTRSYSLTIVRSDGRPAWPGLASLQILWPRSRVGWARCAHPCSCKFCFPFPLPFRHGQKGKGKESHISDLSSY